MGILLAGGGGAFGLGYISSKTVFFLAAAAVAITAITVMLARHHGGGKGFGDKYLHGHGMYNKDRRVRNSQILNVAGYQARAYAALDDDTNADNVRTQIVNTMSNTTSDKNMLHNAMGNIVADINSSSQPGGPLRTAMDERRNGHIDANQFHDKIGEFVRQLCAKHHIPIGLHPYGGTYGRFGMTYPQPYHKKKKRRHRGFQHKYPFATYQPMPHVIPYPQYPQFPHYQPSPIPPVTTYRFPSYGTPFANFSDYHQPEPGLCGPGKQYNYGLGACVPYASPVPDVGRPEPVGRVYGT